MTSRASRTMTMTERVVDVVAGVGVTKPMTTPTMTIGVEAVAAEATMVRKTSAKIAADAAAMMNVAATGTAMTIAGVTGTGVMTVGGIATVSVDVIVTKPPSA